MPFSLASVARGIAHLPDLLQIDLNGEHKEKIMKLLSGENKKAAAKESLNCFSAYQY